MKEKELKRYILKNCWQCEKEITVKYNKTTNEYSRKNNWGYWTENQENKDKYICNSCLLDFYYNRPKEYLKLVENKRKRRVLTSYVYDKTIF